MTNTATEEVLRLHHCWEAIDGVAGDPATTAFKRHARLQQALWRQSQGSPSDKQPTPTHYASKDNQESLARQLNLVFTKPMQIHIQENQCHSQKSKEKKYF